jgi:hypothetical protein
MSLRPLLAPVFAVALSVPAILTAATEFPDGLIPIQLVREFAGGGNIYRSLPDGFPVVTLPPGTDVRVLGSMQRGTVSDVILTTTQSANSLRTVVATAYTAAGWTDLPGGSTNVSSLCHDVHGNLTLMALTSSPGCLRQLHSPSNTSGPTCAERAQDETRWVNYFFDLLPTLTPPPQAVPSSGLGISFFGGMSTRSNSSGTTVSLPRDFSYRIPAINIPGLYAHFAARLSEQGWVNDSEDSGLVSATSVWYRSEPPPEGVDANDTQLTGTMTILHQGGDTYTLSFTLQATTDARVTPGLSVSVREFVPYDIMGNGERPPLTQPTIGIRGIPSGYTPR